LVERLHGGVALAVAGGDVRTGRSKRDGCLGAELLGAVLQLDSACFRLVQAVGELPTAISSGAEAVGKRDAAGVELGQPVVEGVHAVDRLAAAGGDLIEAVVERLAAVVQLVEPGRQRRGALSRELARTCGDLGGAVGERDRTRGRSLRA